MRLYRRLFVSMVLTALCATLSDSQNADTNSNNLPLFQSKVRVVLVDVVVTNTKGESVSGLVKNDFEVLEENQPQKISFFEEHKTPTAAPLKLPPMPPGVFTNFPAAQSPDAVNVLLLDWLNTHPRDQSYVRAQVIKYLKEVPAGTRLAVFVLGDNLRMVHRVTTDSAALLTAFENKDETGPIISRLSGTQENTSGLIVPSPQMTQDAFAMRQSAAAANNAYIGGTRIAVTFEALQRLAKFLSIIPGRKNLLWFSGSFPVTIFPTTDDKTFHAMSQYQKELQLTSDLLTPGQIAIYL